MKTIRTFISASREFDAIRQGLLDLFGQLNLQFRPQGIEFAPAGPGGGARDADVAIILYGVDYGGMPQTEFDRAYASFKATDKPKMYVFFRDSDQAVDGAMRAFRDSFADRYGHFYCHFETLDAVRFQVAVQSLSFLPGGEALHPVRVTGSRVCLGDVPVADLGQLPFARLNAKRRSLLRQLAGAEDEIAELLPQSGESEGDADAEEALRAARARRRELREELKRYEEFLLGAALFFAKGSGEEWDGRTRRARDLFERGQAKEASEALDLKELLQREQREMVERNRRDSEVFRAVRETRLKRMNAFWAKANLVMADYSLPVVERCDQSFTAMEHAIRIAKEVHHDEKETGGMVLALAYMLNLQQRYREGMQRNREALEMFRGIARKEPGFIEVVGCILNNLGTMLQKLGNHREAEAALVESLDIMRSLTAQYPEHEASVGSGLSNLAVLHFWMKKNPEAEREHREALRFLRKWAEEKPGKYQEKLAVALVNHGALLRTLARFPEAEAAFGEAKHIFSKLAVAEPNNLVVQDHVGRVLLNLAAVYRFQGHMADAERTIGDALGQIRELVEANAEAYEWVLANALEERANLYRQLARTDEAERDLEETLAIFGRIRARQPGAAAKDFADALESLGAIRFAGRRLREAEPAYRQALELFREVARADPAGGLPRAAKVLQALAFLHMLAGRPEETERELSEAADICRHLALDNPGVHLATWLEAMDMRAVSYVKMGNPDKAESAMRELLAAVEGLADGHPEAFAPRLADILDKLAGLHLAGQKWAQAEEEYGRSIALRRKPAEGAPEEEVQQRARQDLALAIARSQQGKVSALAPAREAVELYGMLDRRQPGRFGRELDACRQIVAQMAGGAVPG